MTTASNGLGFGAGQGQVGGTEQGWFARPTARPKKIVLIGHDEACELLVEIVKELRSRQHVASLYRNGDVLHAASEVTSADFLLIGLSKAGREVSDINSSAHRNEQIIMEMVACMRTPIPCGVICDINEYISAPYLTKHGGLVRLVAATEKTRVSSLGIFTDYERVEPTVTEIARAVHERLSVALTA